MLFFLLRKSYPNLKSDIKIWCWVNAILFVRHKELWSIWMVVILIDRYNSFKNLSLTINLSRFQIREISNKYRDFWLLWKKWKIWQHWTSISACHKSVGVWICNFYPLAKALIMINIHNNNFESYSKNYSS